MDPIRFSCCEIIPQTPAAIAGQIADVNRWQEFQGYGVLPGIRSACYAHRTSHMVGSQARVENTDGSQHMEDVLKWDLTAGIILKLHSFSPPLNRLADCILETWHFEPAVPLPAYPGNFNCTPKPGQPGRWSG
jgi:hypothetical protein